MPHSPNASGIGQLPRWLWAIHWVIILNFLIQIGYGAYMVFVVIRPDHITGPLSNAALTIPHELMMTRRAYAAETWLAIVGCALYLGITEVLPRRLRRQS